MQATTRLQEMQDDLKYSASELEKIAHALDGHARHLQHSVHQADALVVRKRQDDLQAWASELRELAHGIAPEVAHS